MDLGLISGEYNIWFVASGWTAWLCKELASRYIGRRLSRSGRVGLVPVRARVACDLESLRGELVTVDYFPEMSSHPQYEGCKRFRVEIDCQLFNDTDVQAVYTNLDVDLWGVEGKRMIVRTPTAKVFDEKSGDWRVALSATVPAHGITRLRLELPLAYTMPEAQKTISRSYEGVIANLRATGIDGREVTFRATTVSFDGADLVVWPKRCAYPIYNIVALNEGGLKAGRRPQAPRPRSPYVIEGPDTEETQTTQRSRPLS